MFYLFSRFLENFISSPNNGLVLLLTLLKNIQKFTKDDMKRTAREKLQSKKRAMVSGDTNYNSIREKKSCEVFFLKMFIIVTVSLMY